MDFGSFNALCKYKPSTYPTVFRRPTPPTPLTAPASAGRPASPATGFPPKYLQPHQFTRILTHSIKWVSMPLPQYTASFCRSVGISQKQWGSSSCPFTHGRKNRFHLDSRALRLALSFSLALSFNGLHGLPGFSIHLHLYFV